MPLEEVMQEALEFLSCIYPIPLPQVNDCTFLSPCAEYTRSPQYSYMMLTLLQNLSYHNEVRPICFLKLYLGNRMGPQEREMW